MPHQASSEINRDSLNEAAPDLLEALRLFVAAMDCKMFMPDLMIEAAEKGRLAIAKAEQP